ncbi:MAG: hypothetical protein JNL08_13420 [Planctomycetes bacterium]|nr:hypothetical protein [Planctomycetota bacterium]
MRRFIVTWQEAVTYEREVEALNESDAIDKRYDGPARELGAEALGDVTATPLSLRQSPR